MPDLDLVILVIAGYVAVMSLVRLMRQRQRLALRKLSDEVRRQKARRKAEQSASPPESQDRAA